MEEEKKKQKKPRSLLWRVICWLWILFGAGLLAIWLIFFAISKGWIGDVPSVEDLENPIDKFASQVISADGELLGTYSYSHDNRVWVDYDDLSPYLVQALVSTEDARFVKHSGIDFKALVRAVVKTVIMRNSSSGGGSTITQQLAKLLYTEHVAHSKMKRALQKPIEWVTAVRIERYYTKEEILTMYLNKYDFGNNAIGVRTAANTYFGKFPSELNAQEAAMLVGMCKNSSLYNPRRREEKTRERRNVVLSQMEKAGHLGKAETDSLMALPIELHYHSVEHSQGLATYFRQYLRTVMTAKEPQRKGNGRQSQQYYEDSLDWADNPLYGWCNKNRNQKGKPYDLYSDGLKIYVTIDSHMQQYAEDAVKKHLEDYLQPNFFKTKGTKYPAPYAKGTPDAQITANLNRAMKDTQRYRDMVKAGKSEEEIRKVFETPREMQVFSYGGEIDTVLSPMDSLRYLKFYLRTGFMSMEPGTGYVRAYVGGPNFQHFQYDMVNTGRRQVGSTVKPYLYSMAMESGFSPCDQVLNQKQTILLETGQTWSPRDDGTSKVGELVTIKWGLAHSNNNVTAYLMSQLSPYEFRNLLYEYGLRNRDIDPVPALCLGTCDVSVAEMVSAYTAFPNKGIRTTPLYVLRIEDNAGNVLESFTASSNEVLSEEASYKMIDMMRAVITEGTGGSLRNYYKGDVCGKTGTTNSNADSWFMCYTPELVSGCWVGGDDRDIHFDSMTFGQGARAALPIVGLYLQEVYKDESLNYSSAARFDIPAGFSPCAGPSLSSQEYSIEQF